MKKWLILILCLALPILAYAIGDFNPIQNPGTGTGTTTGTGTNHYWPYWTGATSLGAKSITASKPVCSDSSGDPGVCAGTEGVWQPVCTTSTDLPVATIQLGHASDTTLSRSAAGVAAVEGLKLPRIVASGTVTDDHASIADGNCTDALDGGTATGTLTTDIVLCNFNGDPTAITGFGATGGGLYLYCYPASDKVYVKVCNKTGGAINPTSYTLNWMVLR